MNETQNITSSIYIIWNRLPWQSLLSINFFESIPPNDFSIKSKESIENKLAWQKEEQFPIKSKSRRNWMEKRYRFGKLFKSNSYPFLLSFFTTLQSKQGILIKNIQFPEGWKKVIRFVYSICCHPFDFGRTRHNHFLQSPRIRMEWTRLLRNSN